MSDEGCPTNFGMMGQVGAVGNPAFRVFSQKIVSKLTSHKVRHKNKISEFAIFDVRN